VEENVAYQRIFGIFEILGFWKAYNGEVLISERFKMEIEVFLFACDYGEDGHESHQFHQASTGYSTYNTDERDSLNVRTYELITLYLWFSTT